MRENQVGVCEYLYFDRSIMVRWPDGKDYGYDGVDYFVVVKQT